MSRVVKNQDLTLRWLFLLLIVVTLVSYYLEVTGYFQNWTYLGSVLLKKEPKKRIRASFYVDYICTMYIGLNFFQSYQHKSVETKVLYFYVKLSHQLKKGNGEAWRQWCKVEGIYF